MQICKAFCILKTKHLYDIVLLTKPTLLSLEFLLVKLQVWLLWWRNLKIIVTLIQLFPMEKYELIRWLSYTQLSGAHAPSILLCHSYHEALSCGPRWLLHILLLHTTCLNWRVKCVVVGDIIFASGSRSRILFHYLNVLKVIFTLSQEKLLSNSYITAVRISWAFNCSIRFLTVILGRE